jgi:hypothetical protein
MGPILGSRTKKPLLYVTARVAIASPSLLKKNNRTLYPRRGMAVKPILLKKRGKKEKK